MPQLNKQYFINQSILSMDLLHTKSIPTPYKIRRFFQSAKNKKALICSKLRLFKWALTDSNRGPSACKADALNQLS